MPGVIEALINSGRQIDAVNLAFQLELTEQFPPEPLLQSYLEQTKNVSSAAKPGNASPSSPNVQNDEVNEREFSATKAVIKCVEEHKLEEKFPLDSLSKRLLQLEKTKAEKKQASEAPRPQSKRARATNTGYVPRMGPTNNPPYPPQYVFDNQSYNYATGQIDNHCAPPPLILGATTYGFLSLHPHPGHGNYYTNGNGYQYQQSHTYFH